MPEFTIILEIALASDTEISNANEFHRFCCKRLVDDNKVTCNEEQSLCYPAQKVT